MNKPVHLPKTSRDLRDTVVDIVRIAMGAFLLANGVQYMLSQSAAMLALEMSAARFLPPTIVIPAVTIFLLVGGTMLIAGMLTRTAAALNIPLFFFFLFVHDIRDFSGLHYSPYLDAVVLATLVVLMYFGSGAISIDYYLRVRQLKAISEAVDERREPLDRTDGELSKTDSSND